MEGSCSSATGPASAAHSIPQREVAEQSGNSVRTPDSGSLTAPAPARARHRRRPAWTALATVLAAVSLGLLLPLAAGQALVDAPRRPPTPEEARLLPPAEGFTAVPSLPALTPDFDAEAAAELKQVWCSFQPRARHIELDCKSALSGCCVAAPPSTACQPDTSFRTMYPEEQCAWFSVGVQVVRNNGSAAIAWFNSPQYYDEQGDTTIAVSKAPSPILVTQRGVTCHQHCEAVVQSLSGQPGNLQSGTVVIVLDMPAGNIRSGHSGATLDMPVLPK